MDVGELDVPDAPTLREVFGERFVDQMQIALRREPDPVGVRLAAQLDDVVVVSQCGCQATEEDRDCATVRFAYPDGPELGGFVTNVGPLETSDGNGLEGSVVLDTAEGPEHDDGRTLWASGVEIRERPDLRSRLDRRGIPHQPMPECPSLWESDWGPHEMNPENVPQDLAEYLTQVNDDQNRNDD